MRPVERLKEGLQALWPATNERRDIWIKTLSGFSVAFLVGFAAWAFVSFERVVQFLTRDFVLPLWVVFLLSCIFLWWFATTTKSLKKASVDGVPEAQEGEFDGILWRWINRSNQVSDLKPFCPKCNNDGVRRDTELVLKERRDLESTRFFDPSNDEDEEAVTGTEIYCPMCNSTLIHHNAFNVPDLARRKIERDLRAGVSFQSVA